MDNRRRNLVVALGVGALAAPFASLAQPESKVWRVGFLASRTRPALLDSDYFGGFLQGMRELGYVDGKNMVIEWRFADKVESLPHLAAELIRLKVDVIVAAGSQATSVAQKATTMIPIVMGNSNDPIGSGFVKTLAHPGGNITGLSNIAADLGPKLVEMLLTIAPKLARITVLVNPTSPSNLAILKKIQAAAQSASLKVLAEETRTAKEIENIFSKMNKENAGAVIALTDSLFVQQRRQIADLAVSHSLPSIAAFREFALAGGLMSYGTSFADLYRRAATYVDKIFKGAKPGDLPVEQPTKFELLINGKTAKVLGLKIPQSLLITADKVIE